MIRPYRPTDRDELLTVWRDSAAVAHPFWTPAIFEQERRSIAEEFLPVAETYVFERDGAVVGFISLLGSEVGGIFVAPSCHGQGIGRALMDLARRSREHLELDVFEANDIGRAFYAACGFGVVGEKADERTGRRVLRLRLPAPSGEGRTAGLRPVPERRDAGIRRLAILTEGAILAVALALLWWTGLWPRLGFDPVDWTAGVVLGVVLAGLAMVLVHSEAAVLDGIREDLRRVIDLFSRSSVVDLAVISALAGICEEALFRGVVQAWVATWANGDIAVLVAAAVFGAAHAISVRYALFVTGFGLVLGYLFAFTDSLVAAMLAHAVYDFVALYWATRRLPGRSPTRDG